MSQGSNRISNSIEMNAAVVELLEDVMKENDGKEGKENVIFFAESKNAGKGNCRFFQKYKDLPKSRSTAGRIPK